MRKTWKKVLLIFLIAVGLIIGAFVLIAAYFRGAFTPPKEIAIYNSPDGEYSLAFEDLCHYRGLFGPTEARLTLRNHGGKKIDWVSFWIFDDGASPHESNIASVSWNTDAVVVVITASEMEDMEVSIAYGQK